MAYLAFVVCAGLALPTRAATTITVKDTSDHGLGSLRLAIAAAVNGDTIDFDPSLAGQTITLLTQIDISPNITIDGGANRITLSGNLDHRVIRVLGEVTIKALTIRDGVEGSNGAGILNYGNLTLIDVTIRLCQAGVNGGGIWNEGALFMYESTISECVASGNGGAIGDLNSSYLYLQNSTVSGNVAGSGGGIWIDPNAKSAQLVSSTVANNLASGEGGGIFRSAGPLNALYLDSSILSGNAAPTGPDCSGTLTSSSGKNVVKSVSGCTLTGTTTSNVVGQDAKLGALRLNGGIVKTHALLAGSPAIDRGNASCVGIDARGLGRPQDGDANGSASCDSGAYEASRPIVVTSLVDPGDAGTCTLRQAVAAADTNAVAGTCAAGTLEPDMPDRITFGVTGKVTLASDLVIPSSMMVDGPGADRITIGKTAPATRVQIVFYDPYVEPKIFILSGVTVHLEGSAPDAVQMGGLAADHRLAIDRCYLREAQLIIGAGSAEVTSSTIAFTTSFASITMDLSNATVVLTDSTVVTPSGYAISVLSSATMDLTLVNCTIAGTGPGFHGIGAGANPGVTTIVRYQGSVFAGFSAENIWAGYGAPQLVSLGYNVSSDASGGLSGPGDLPSTDPKLGVLAYNGGPVPTFNLKPGSPAIGRIPGAALRTTVDERGFPRQLTGLADAGAVERVVGGDVNGDGSVNVGDVFALINFLFAGAAPPAGEGDVNGDGAVTVADVFYLINRLFAGGPAPV